ncbi:hypothetical protein CRG98_039744 [Punica granatum]|uniref:Uncharacterized protein n=1 Tax=Punica granatum TaxID=22663 RepID=A0A2I0I785_PUNGR|nr:hypothetical protein CRG98_039744 [Punica granatum]
MATTTFDELVGREKREGKRVKEWGLGPPAEDPNPTTEVADTHKGCWKPRGWGRDHQLVVLAPEPPIDDLDPTSMVASILCGCRQLRWWV